MTIHRCILLLLLLAACTRKTEEKPSSSAPAPATSPTGSAPAPATSPTGPAEDSLEAQITQTAWKGDIDEIVKRRMLRVIVPFSRPEFFYQNGAPAGILPAVFQEFEKLLNERYKTDASNHVTVVLLPTSRDQFQTRMQEGYADVAAGSIYATEARKAQFDFSVPTYPDAKALIVTGPAAPVLQTLDDLGGKEIWVHSYTPYNQDLENLNAQLRARGKPPAIVRVADSKLEIEDLLEMVNAGVYGITVAQSPAGRFWAQVFHQINVREDLVVSPKVDLAWAMRKDCPGLKAFVNEFVGGHRLGTSFGNTLVRRYLQSADYVINATSKGGLKKFQATVDLFRKYGDEYKLDHLLLMSQGYQESRLDNNARSGAGAVGIMQIKPSTAEGPPIGIKNVQQIDNNIHAGALLLHYLIQDYFNEPAVDRVDRHLFALAAYNAGPARITKLRAKAKEMGLDPNQWFRNVEVAAARDIGRETTQYVANIYKYYLAYKLAEEEEERKKQAARVLDRETAFPSKNVFQG